MPEQATGPGAKDERVNGYVIGVGQREYDHRDYDIIIVRLDDGRTIDYRLTSSQRDELDDHDMGLEQIIGYRTSVLDSYAGFCHPKLYTSEKIPGPEPRA